MYTKKLFQLVALLVLVSTAVFAQSTTWSGGAGNTDWLNTNNWSGGVPEATVDAYIETHTFMPVLTGPATCKNLIVVSGTLDLGASTATTQNNQITVGGNVDIQTGGTIAGNTGKIMLTGNWIRTGTFYTGTGSTIEFKGGSSQSIASTNFYNLTINKTVGTAATLGGDVIVGNLLSTAAGTLNGGTGTTISLTGTVPTPFSIVGGVTSAFVPGTSTVNFKNTVNSNVPSGTFYNLGINRSTFTFTAAGALTINGELRVDAGIFVTGTYTHDIKGSLTVVSGATFTATAAGTLNFNGASAQQIPPLTYSGVTVNNPAGVTVSSGTSALTITALMIGNVTANSILNDGGNQINTDGTIGLTLSIDNNSTLKLGSGSSATVMPSPLTIATMTTGTTIDYAATANQTVAASASYKNLTLSGGGTKTLGTSTVAGTLLVQTGVAATIPSGVTITSSFMLTNNGTIGLNGTLNVNGGAAAPTTITTQSIGTLTGAGTLAFNPTGPQTVNLGTINSNTSTGTVTFNNLTNVITFVANSTVSNFVTVNLAAPAANTVAGIITPPNDWNIASGGTLNLGAATSLSVLTGRTITIAGNLVAVATSAITSNGTISVAGTQCQTDVYAGTGAFSYNPNTAGTMTFGQNFTSTGTVTLGGTALITFAGSAPTAFKNLTVNNTAATPFVAIGSWTINGDLVIGAGSTVSLGTNNVKVGGNITETGGFTGAAGSKISFIGTANQTWALASARTTYATIDLDVSMGYITGGATKLTISGGDLSVRALSFAGTGTGTVGLVNMSGNTLALTNVAPAGTDVKHVYNGNIKATVLVNVGYTFPVGDGSAICSFTLTSPTTAPGVTTVGFVNSDPGGTNPSLQFASSGPASIQVSRASAYYWTVNTTTSLAAQTDLAITLGKHVNDPFQDYDKVRMVVRNLSTDAWSDAVGTYANTQGATAPIINDIQTLVISSARIAGLSNGAKTIAYGLASAVVNVGGMVYYGDYPGTTGFEVGNVTVNITSTTPVVNTNILIATGASTVGYSFGKNIAGITSGYQISVTTLPAWAGVTGTSSTDAVAVRNTIVGRTVGAITAAETMKIIAADVDNSGGAVVCANTNSYTGGEVTFTASPALTALTSIDVMQILQRAAGTISTFTRGNYYSTVHRTGTSLLSDLTGQTVRVIAVGDASWSTVPSTLKKQHVMFANDGNLNVDAKKAFMVPITLTSETIEAAAFAISVKYPSDRVQFKGIVSSLKGVTAVEHDGYIGLMFIDMTGEKAAKIAKGSELVSIKFEPKESFNANTGLSLELDKASFSNNDAVELSLALSSPHVGMSLPAEFALSQNYPNPFNPTTSLDYAVPEMGRISVKIYNVLGQEVATLFDGIQEPGRYTTQWNANNLASGVYIVRMTGSSASKDFSSVKKVMLLK